MSGNEERMRRFPEIILERCDDCPYCQWDSEPCGPDGYKCFNDNGDSYGQWLLTDSWYRHLKKQGKNTDIEIPEDCPLEKVGGV